MDVLEKLKILSGAAKYDVACTSSGVNKQTPKGGIGNAYACGICHSFSSDGRCISLLKVLYSNACIYDCQYCVNRRSNDIPRATFEPRELADLTINFYRRNYIEGLFISSGVVKNPDYTTERLIETISILRNEYNFHGYIHAKVVPGTDAELVSRLGLISDRLSVNIELPSQQSLNLLAPDKSKSSIIKPMGHIQNKITESKGELTVYKGAPKFAPAGQSTQMIIGATPETDYQILALTESLYEKYKLKRVFFSAYIPVSENSNLPSLDTKPPLLREHRLYQCDWLMRFYGFKAGEILDEKHQSLNPYLDPKCNWAINHMELFPVEINRADYEMLLRVPGIGTVGAKRIIAARRCMRLDFDHLKKMGVVLKRAKFFITCNGKRMEGLIFNTSNFINSIISDFIRADLEKIMGSKYQQISFWDKDDKEDILQCLIEQSQPSGI
ncbi:MAG: putative DNA modification/repair radical SAM protein [Eubacteriales bacterium]|nr:putative DNA modification/repair radical SAM protein [Eubacteriales bacterium]